MFVADKTEVERWKRISGVYEKRTCRQVVQQTDEFSSLLSLYLRYASFAGYTMNHARQKLQLIACIDVAILFVALVTGSIYVVLGVVLHLAIEFVLLKNKIAKRVRLFEQDYTAFLLSLASAVKTGIDPLQSFIESAQLFESGSILRSELLKVKEAVERGESERGAVQSFARSIPHPDVKLFRTAFLLARREGSSLGECLQRLAKVTRHRQSFRRRIRSAVAMQRLSAYGIAGCALVIAFMQYGTNPKGVQLVLTHPVGMLIVFSGVLLMICGIGIMLYISRSRL